MGKIEKWNTHIPEYVRKLLTIWTQIKQGLPFFINVWNTLIYVKEATVSFKMQTLGDCSNTGQSAFSDRTLCLLRLSNIESKWPLVHFLSFVFFNGLWTSCLKKHLSSNSKWFLYHVVFWNANAENEGFFAKKSRDDSFIFSWITFIPKEFPVQSSGICHKQRGVTVFRLHLLLTCFVTLGKLLKFYESLPHLKYKKNNA